MILTNKMQQCDSLLQFIRAIAQPRKCKHSYRYSQFRLFSRILKLQRDTSRAIRTLEKPTAFVKVSNVVIDYERILGSPLREPMTRRGPPVRMGYLACEARRLAPPEEPVSHGRLCDPRESTGGRCVKVLNVL